MNHKPPCAYSKATMWAIVIMTGIVVTVVAEVGKASDKASEALDKANTQAESQVWVKDALKRIEGKVDTIIKEGK